MKPIRKVAVLGSGVMGATIAAQVANASLSVLLLDMVPGALNENEKHRGLTLQDAAVRNRIVSAGRDGLKKMKPAPLYAADLLSGIEIGNFEDDAERLAECDWVIEVVVEDLEIKKKLLCEKVAPNLKEGAILTTNTSGLSVNALAEALPEPLRKNFLVTHFFNPPRYMRLLEIVPCRYTDPSVTAFMADFCRRRLGKGIVYGKDTPNFIANRIGVFAICNAMRHMVELGLTVEEVDSVSGPATARAGSATFRTCDLVGIDTLLRVAENTGARVKDDVDRSTFTLPAFVSDMVNRGLTGNKAKQGFFKKGEDRTPLYYDYDSGTYLPSRKPQFGCLAAARKHEDPGARLKAVVSGSDPGSEFAWRNLRDLLIYAVRRMPEIADRIVDVDNAMKWGFSWELGPFEMLDALGVGYFLERAAADGIEVPASLRQVERFYRFDGNALHAYDFAASSYRPLPLPADRVRLDQLRHVGKVVAASPDASVLDLGDGVFCLEFHSKMNAIGDATLEMAKKAVAVAETKGVGLVVANQGKVFSAGANLSLVSAYLKEGAVDRIDTMVRAFQEATMALKYAAVPVVAAPFNLALGGGCEFALHADAVTAHAETYMGLVEVGVGLLPAGGGTKELALRAIELAARYQADVAPFITKQFRAIAGAKVSGSAMELFEMGLMREGDAVTMDLDSLVADAKRKVLALARTYRPRKPPQGLPAPGRSVAAGLKAQAWNLMAGGFATEYDVEIARVIADVMTGGDVPPGTPISEQYLLDLEREAFLRLCGSAKTLERIEHMLKTGKALRN